MRHFFRPWRRMREAAYKRGYVDAMADMASQEGPVQTGYAHRPPTLPSSWAKVQPLEDPFPASDWAADPPHTPITKW